MTTFLQKRAIAFFVMGLLVPLLTQGPILILAKMTTRAMWPELEPTGDYASIAISASLGYVLMTRALNRFRVVAAAIYFPLMISLLVMESFFVVGLWFDDWL